MLVGLFVLDFMFQCLHDGQLSCCSTVDVERRSWCNNYFYWLISCCLIKVCHVSMKLWLVWSFSYFRVCLWRRSWILNLISTRYLCNRLGVLHCYAHDRHRWREQLCSMRSGGDSCGILSLWWFEGILFGCLSRISFTSLIFSNAIITTLENIRGVMPTCKVGNHVIYDAFAAMDELD